MSDDQSPERIAAARAYVDALVSHDPSGVALHPDCTRVEFGVRTGRSGAHIARSLARGPQFRLIRAVSDVEASIDGHTVVTRYLVHVHPAPLRLAAEVREVFVVDDELRIRAIVARFGVPRRVVPAETGTVQGAVRADGPDPRLPGAGRSRTREWCRRHSR